MERANSIRAARVKVAGVKLALLLAALFGLPLLWRQMRRGVPGVTLRPPPGFPSMAKVVLGAFAIGSLACTLLYLLMPPLLKLWFIPALKAMSPGTMRVIFTVTSMILILDLPVVLEAWLMGRLCHGRLRLAFRYAGARLRDVFHWRTFLTGAALLLLIYVLRLASQLVLSGLGIRSTYLDFLSRFDPNSGPVVNIIVAVLYCIAAPVTEEIIYRGYLLQGLKDRFGFWPTALLSSAVFSAMHHYSVPGTVDTFFFGLILCAVMHRTGKLSLCIMAHFLWNLIVTLNARS
jgi:membrane protease YdiL (CAAX protease family)